MKKILFILFATLLFCGEAWAGSPVSVLQVGHYYRVRNSSTGHYLCWAGQEGEGGSIFAGTDAFRQPMILISADKALTSPGTIFKYEKKSSRDALSTQGIEVGQALSSYAVAFQLTHFGIRSADWGTNSKLTFNCPNPDNSKKFSIETSAGTNGTWEEARVASAEFPDGYLAISSATTNAQWYFEEVDGASANNVSNGEMKSMGGYLGFPPVDESYNVKYSYYSGSSTSTTLLYGQTEDGPRSFQITDMTSGQDADNTTWYYATMCLPFDVEVPSNVQCFFVNSSKQVVDIGYNDNNLDGTGRYAKKVNVIPAGTAFLARSQSNNPNDNRFVPYIPPTGTVYAPTNNSVNQLKNATNSYLVKNAQNNNTINLYKLSATANGEVEFLTEIRSNTEKTDGNRAYFGQQSEPIVYEPEEVELADLIYQDNGTKWTDKDYVKISDDLLVCYVNEKVGLVFARDVRSNNNMSGDNQTKYWDKVTTTPDNYYNFTPEEGNVVGAAQKLLEPLDYDQSNWVIISVPVSLASSFTAGMTIPSGNLKGYMQTDKTRPAFNMLAVENQSGNASVNLNTYSVAHLMADNTTHLLTSGFNGNDYFFMTPKPAEVANVTWAILKKVGDNVYAYIPAKDDERGDNALDFHGRVLLSPAFYSGNTNDWTEEKLQELEGKAICFKAAITPENGKSMVGAPRRAEGPSINENDETSTQHVVYPLDLSPTNVIVTSVNGVKSTATVKSMKFYNLQGIESDVPFDGINIVVEQLNDGTTRSSKMLF